MKRIATLRPERSDVGGLSCSRGAGGAARETIRPTAGGVNGCRGLQAAGADGSLRVRAAAPGPAGRVITELQRWIAAYGVMPGDTL